MRKIDLYYIHVSHFYYFSIYICDENNKNFEDLDNLISYYMNGPDRSADKKCTSVSYTFPDDWCHGYILGIFRSRKIDLIKEIKENGLANAKRITSSQEKLYKILKEGEESFGEKRRAHFPTFTKSIDGWQEKFMEWYLEK